MSDTAIVTHEQGSRFALRNWRLRSKHTAVVMVPLVTALVLGYLRVSTEMDDAGEANRATIQVELSAAVTELVHEIQAERYLVVGWVAAGKTGDSTAVMTQIERVDDEVAGIRAASGSVADLDEAVRELYTNVLSELSGLDGVRTYTEQSDYPASSTELVYERVVAALLRLSREVTRVSDDRVISQQAATFAAAAAAKEQLAIQNSILRAAASSGSFRPGQLERLVAARTEFTATLNDFETSASPAARARYANTVAGTDVDERLRLLDIAEDRGGASTTGGIDGGRLDAAAVGTLDKIRQVEIASLDDLRETAHGLFTSARNNAIRDAALVVAALLLGLVLMLVVARSLLRPLRVLRNNALEVAYVRLPQTVHQILDAPNPVEAAKHAVAPVPVFTREETGELARSFDVVHGQAVKMATEQAVLRDNINSIFVNLSRRSQGLVERLLTVLDRLERDEQDPDQLATLFEVDHLATRMRRNCESLLVLSGAGPSRRLDKPVPVSEVLGAAQSETEHYDRIELGPPPHVTVHSRAVSDLVHLIAELLDNATYFSEPHKKVLVRAAATRRGELVIQIMDAGIGMSAKEVEAANERLAEPPDMDVAVTLRMGLYVVARLARKHNITVRLAENEDIDGGLVARITVPADLVSSAAVPGSSGPTAAMVLTGPRTIERGGPATAMSRVREASLVDSPTEQLPVYQAVLPKWFDPTGTGSSSGAIASRTAEGAQWPAAEVSAGGDGWRAARDLLADPVDAQRTTAGLPKRVPHTRATPGSAGTRSRPEASEQPATVPRQPLSADRIRDRMSRIQQGVQRGRHSVLETGTGNRPGADHHQQREVQE